MSTSSQLRLTVILLGAIAGLITVPLIADRFAPLANSALAQTSSEDSLPTPDNSSAESPTLELGTKGDVVEELQIVLKRLNYYEGEATGEYDEATQAAVANFQADNDLESTGIFDVQTFEILEKRNLKAQRKAKKRAALQAHKRRRLLILGVGGTFGLTGLLGGTYFLFRFVNQVNGEEGAIAPETSKFVTVPPAEPLPPRQPLNLSPVSDLQPVQPPRFETITVMDDVPVSALPPVTQPPAEAPLDQDVWSNVEPETVANAQSPELPHQPEVEPSLEPQSADIEIPPQPILTSPPTASTALTTANGHVAQDALALHSSPAPLPPADPVESLIRELHSPHPEKRRRAIWDLAQQSDSRAVQPLVNLLLDSDSQQQSLVLEALSQIGVRTLKPINRALALSLQDDNSQVRKNAIRDVTRIYELISQLSQLIFYATEDPDVEVQETAKWALEQIKNIRIPHQRDS